MVRTAYTKEEIMHILSVIPDPEIPAVSIYEMGMLRDVVISDKGYEIVITPTYSGCPAMSIIAQDIKMTLEAGGITPVTVKLVYDPAWTTDWMSAGAKEKLRKYGIAPPLHSSCAQDVFADNIIECPRCQSDDTVLLSRFGSTACKSLYKCNNCKEPFEYFKCH
ncbi:MAG: paaJ [Flavipsychrobacter sp.]|nr:paaJ [Flavipsychrobacter sp.]